ncbi:MAG TPA: excinuclease ABC subunit UvrA [Candidatus Deferrimicrobium sp.]|nr:excinuclease ABC subunit UvrA [Candidatus Deferrimicrobium sp.]
MKDSIIIKGAREHNLKNINVELPRNKLIVITGLSGSGKSSLAFDTIYAEGQRRYIESLSAYARQFLGQMRKPKVEFIEGLSPAISIEQRPLSHNPRSTVATITEIYDYLRLLYGRIGHPHCPKCGKEVQKQTLDQIVDQVFKNFQPDARIQILAPIIQGKKGEYKKLFENFKKEGYSRVRVDGEIKNLDESFDLDKKKKHDVDVVIDRLKLKNDIRTRLAGSIQTALELSGGIVTVDNAAEKKEEIIEHTFNESLSCVECGINLPEISPRIFSFNSPFGACTECDGLGTKTEIDPNLLIPDKSLSIEDGAIKFLGDGYYFQMLETVADHFGFNLSTPFERYSKAIQETILYGTDEKIHFEIGSDAMKHNFERGYEGIASSLQRRYIETKSEFIRTEITKFMSTRKCPVCNGDRLKPEILAVTVNEENIANISRKSVLEIYKFFTQLPEKLTETENLIAKEIIKEIKARLEFLLDVGLNYITLDRKAETLSAGEAQRIHLATQIGTNLVGVLYILDEPTIGLHQRDNLRLIETLKKLRELGNTVIVVEHDEATIRAADYILDLGPGAGIHGGEIVAEGPLDAILNSAESLTGQYLTQKKMIPIPKQRRSHNGKYLIIRGARQNNLKNIDVKIPLGVFTCVTGVSGAGKSSLISDILSNALSRDLNRAQSQVGDFDRLEGTENLDKAIIIDQSPIGRTPRSNPATYTGVFTDIRELFSNTKDSRVHGYKPGRFSFNVKGGRCEFCEGAGLIRIDMYFLPPALIPCEICKGKRYNRETLEIKYNGKNIAQVLNMTVEEALSFFENIPKIQRKLQTLYDVGLGYIQLGQSAPNLSGGEAQRVKLARELSKVSTGRTFYILDEPTTGLHFADIEKLLNVLDRLVEKGNTVVVIEHNLDVIKTADWIIDLGPEGGDEGGFLIAEGTPEAITQVIQSYTGQFLKEVLTKTTKKK